MLQPPHTDPMPAILGLRERAQVFNRLLEKRFDTLLPQVMRETGFDTWLILCYEDNYDPVFKTITPWECWAPLLQIVVFHDRGPEEGIERLNISRTDMQGFMQDVWDPNGEEDQWACLRRVLEERQPARIGINESPVIWAADGLTASLKAQLVEALGPDLSGKLESAESLCIRWLETRLPEELQLYHHIARIAHTLIREVFSRRAITPGLTTCEDLRWYYWQRVSDLGLEIAFPPFFHRIRSHELEAEWGAEDPIIRPGDMLHCDVGIRYLGLITDHQELAYVLRPSEHEPPRGLRDGMMLANRLQHIFTAVWREGLSGNEILARTLNRAYEIGLREPKVFSHSLGYFLHEPGPLMGLPWDQSGIPGRGEVVMHHNTCYAVELSVKASVPEWNGQEVTFTLEQDACFVRAAFGEEPVIFLDGRQTEFHLI